MPIRHVTSRVRYQAIQASAPDFVETLEQWGILHTLSPEILAEMQDAAAWVVRSPNMMMVCRPEDFADAWDDLDGDEGLLPALGAATNADVKLTYTSESGWVAEIFVIRPDSTSLGKALYTGKLPVDGYQVEAFTHGREVTWVATDDPAMPKWMRDWAVSVLAGHGVVVSDGG